MWDEFDEVELSTFDFVMLELVVVDYFGFGIG